MIRYIVVKEPVMRKKSLRAIFMVLAVVCLVGCTRQAYNNKDVAFFGSPGVSPSATSAPSATPAPSATGARSGWTVMIYLNGSDLESENGQASQNLNSLLSVQLPENIRVLVFTGGTAKWQNAVISPNCNQIWLVQDGELVLLESYDSKSIGSSSTLSQFIEYGQAYAPYDSKALIFWDHGAGSVIGFGSDELFNYDGLYLYEMADAMEKSYDGTPFDLIGFDACLMASVETACVFAPYAEVLVASEEVEPGSGWDYRSFFNQLALDPSMTGEELGIAITDTYYDRYQNTPTEGYITCSVIDLEVMPELEASLGEFSRGLSSIIMQPVVMETLSAARQNTESYGEEPDTVSFDMVDLYHFVGRQTSAGAAATEKLKSAIEQAIVYEISGSQRQFSYGLSIYFPFLSKEYFDYCLDIYGNIDFCPEYQAFITDFAARLTDPDFMAEVPEFGETAVFEVPEIGQSEDFSEVGSYYVQLSDEQLEYLGYVYCTLGWYMDDGTLIDLGDDSDLTFDEDNTLHDDFEGSWTGLNGRPVALYILEETDDYLLYNIPIYYNGQTAVIKCAWVWDESYSKNGYYVINGVFLSNDETSMPDTRMEVTVKPGDTVVPVYHILDSPHGTKGYYQGNPIVVAESGLALDLVWLPDGWYQYGFKFIDIFGGVYYSQLVDIEIGG
jgi:Clostripain family.